MNTDKELTKQQKLAIYYKNRIKRDALYQDEDIRKIYPMVRVYEQFFGIDFNRHQFYDEVAEIYADAVKMTPQ